MGTFRNDRNGPYCLASVSLTVDASGASTFWRMFLNVAEAVGTYLGVMLVYVNCTSAEVKSWPSCHSTPFRKCRVYCVPSADASHDSASWGLMLRSLST